MPRARVETDRAPPRGSSWERRKNKAKIQFNRFQSVKYIMMYLDTNHCTMKNWGRGGTKEYANYFEVANSRARSYN